MDGVVEGRKRTHQHYTFSEMIKVATGEHSKMAERVTKICASCKAIHDNAKQIADQIKTTIGSGAK